MPPEHLLINLNLVREWWRTGAVTVAPRGREGSIDPHLYRAPTSPSQPSSLVMPILFINAIDCLALSLFFYLLIAFRDHRRRRGLPYPPGPPSLPIIGNLFDVPKEVPWIAYADMSNKYGITNILVTAPHPN